MVKSQSNKNKLGDYINMYKGLSRQELYEKFTQLLKKYYLQVMPGGRKYYWPNNARDDQKVPDGNWRVWLIMAGRGFGKTRCGAETIKQWVDQGKCRHVALVGNTISDVENVMINGESGLLNMYPSQLAPKYEKSKGTITWACGAKATIYSAHAYEKLRGPQFDGAWVDEFAKFSQPEAVFDQLNFALRKGKNPQMLITTTPRAIPFLNNMVANAQQYKIHVTTGSTFDNKENLSDSYIEYMNNRYANSRLGRQELYGELIMENDQALWDYELIEKSRVQQCPDLAKVIVAVDPAVSSGENGDETGINVCGIDDEGKGYVLADLSIKTSTKEWAQRVVQAYEEYGADMVVAEANNGGDLVADVLRNLNKDIPVKLVHASRGKYARAGPVAYLYDLGKIKHYVPNGSDHLRKLEEQMCTWSNNIKNYSPDRIDALVWGFSYLLLGKRDNNYKLWNY